MQEEKTTALEAVNTNHPVAPATDLNTLMRVSEMLAQSDLVPQSYRGRPANVLLASIAGQPYGWDPTMSMRSFNVIQGQPTLKPEIMLALVRRAGHSVTGETSNTGATITGRRADTGDTMTVTFAEADARQAGLLGKGAWKTYPDAMFWARALSKLCRMLFPDVVLGAGYTAEELTSSGVADVHEAPSGPPVAEAKTALVEAAGGDKGLARSVWEQFVPSGPVTHIEDNLLTEMVEACVAKVAEAADADVIDAEIVEESEAASV